MPELSRLLLQQVLGLVEVLAKASLQSQMLGLAFMRRCGVVVDT